MTLDTGGGGGGGGGVFMIEATIVNYNGNGMTINVNEGARGEADQKAWTQRGYYERTGFVGSAGKVFLVSIIFLIVRMCLKLHLIKGITSSSHNLHFYLA